MAFFRMPRWLRRMIRARSHPMEEKKAFDMKSKLSIAYAIIAWNAFGYVLYMCATGRRNWPVAYGVRTPEEDLVRPAVQWAHTLSIKKAEVIRISGLDVSEPETIETEPKPESESIN